MKTVLRILLFSLIMAGGYAQQPVKKAWEISLGGNALGLSRIDIAEASKKAHHYFISVDKRSVLFGGHIGIGKEIGRHWAVDLTQSVSYDKEFALLTNLGIRYRLGEYFRPNPLFDPYLTIGTGYFFNGFSKESPKIQIDGKSVEYKTPHQIQGKHLIPIYGGVGINLWFNDHWGLNMESGYQAFEHMDRSGLWYARVGIKMRIGGEPKIMQPKTEIRYVEKVIEKIVEKEVKVAPASLSSTSIPMLLEGIFFAFNSSVIDDTSKQSLDQTAAFMLQNNNKRFLISGFTDNVGSDEYNDKLSNERAKAVVNALISRGVPQDKLKYRGLGKRVALAPKEKPDSTRKQDRKIMIEIIESDDYWSSL
ncbi:OmpA family protein [Porphyromonas sp. COT-108 OH2963]|uniref:OmpA family protein n=1 Tax=Porphyromonas sp. COT-108 OH2963 TaxID=1515614 RepID=UPI00055A9536|nr:OmpA family protein [Porphyromonas sp. COT-108 OH2963]